MARILVTGATGFLGGRLVAHLSPQHEIWALARHIPANGGARVTWLQQDLAADQWTAALPGAIDAVIHLAQSAHFRDFPDRAKHIYAVAAGATMRLLDLAHQAGARHFILASTGGLYGMSDRPVRETDPLPEIRSQLGFYFAAKRASELLVTQYATMLNAVILRFFFLYGSRQASGMLMPRIAGNIREGRTVYLHGENGLRFNPVHVDDAVAAIDRCLTLGESRTFNIAGPEVAYLRDIAMAIGRQVKRDPVFTVDNTVEPNHLVADIQRMSSGLGAPKIGIEAGLAELCRSLA
jgi:UDP-glucose 4-epimerase